MDSMVGYKNEKYRYFGTCAARLDDVLNFIPSRLAALLMILAAFISPDGRGGGMEDFRRDRKNHASPNSAQTESVMAGALWEYSWPGMPGILENFTKRKR